MFCNYRFLAFSFLILFFTGINYPATANNDYLAKLQNVAKNFLGAKYRYGATGENNSFDCSGLIFTLIKRVTNKQPELPRNSQDMFSQLPTKIDLKEAKIGDLLFFNSHNSINHVGMYWGKDDAGKDLMLHASSSKGVQIIPFMESGYWGSRFIGAKRYKTFSDYIAVETESITKSEDSLSNFIFKSPYHKNDDKMAS